MYHDVNPEISTPAFPSRKKNSCYTLRNLHRIILIMLLGLDKFLFVFSHVFSIGGMAAAQGQE